MATKRRGHGEGSIKQRADGLWEARVSLEGGKRKSFYGKTRKEAQDKLRAALRDVDAGLDLSVGRQTVGQFLDRWLEDAVKPRVRPKTHQGYAQLIRLYIVPAFGHVQLTNLSPQHVQSMMAAMTAAGLSPRTVQFTRAVLRSALGQALKWGLVSRNVATLVDPPRMVKKRVTALSTDEARGVPGLCSERGRPAVAPVHRGRDDRHAASRAARAAVVRGRPQERHGPRRAHRAAYRG